MFFVATSLAVLSGWKKIKAAALWTVAGILLEYYQFFFTTDRSFDWFDFVADTVGVVLAVFLFRKKALNR
jgi:VanZ family protein